MREPKHVGADFIFLMFFFFSNPTIHIIERISWIEKYMLIAALRNFANAATNLLVILIQRTDVTRYD